MASSKNLIIVESPAKVKTIKKYLGSGYSVDASQGHVRDLPKSRLGVLVDEDFEPEYITIRGKGELLTSLRKKAKGADKIYLATDPDREGEAISWHLLNSLKIDPNKKVYRISFNEITQKAIKESLKNPREIDMNLVDAQQARRVLDRIVGYRISPILWAKIKRGLSAGRVQSVALRMICDREDEINAFVPEEYWTIDAELFEKGSKKAIKASYIGKINKKEECDNILKSVEGADYIVKEVTSTDKYRKAPLPFTTSTLQQEAGKKLNLSASKTMRLAQELYEGVNIDGYGNVALITYLRTDSTRISDEADKNCKLYISANYGEKYVNHSAGSDSKQKSNVQDAHEAIRPTDITFTPAMVKDSLSRDLWRLYQLIWKRFVASRMQPACYEQKSAKINANGNLFGVSASRIKFEGFLTVYKDDEEEKKSYFGRLEEGDLLDLGKLEPCQHFTQPPAHYTESSLVKALEDEGIGRPSTYAPTISTIVARHYITKEKKNLYVTELGSVVNSMITKQFPEIVDIHFTADMESKLDKVAEGELDWKEIVRDFYPAFDKEVIKAEKELEEVTIEDEVSDEICELCGRNMVIKYGPHGKFLACPGYPECKNTKPYLEKVGIACPKCGSELVLRRTKKGRVYYGCIGYPECDFMSWQKPKA